MTRPRHFVAGLGLAITLTLVPGAVRAQVGPGTPGGGGAQPEEDKPDGVAEAAPKTPGLLPTTPTLPPPKGKRNKFELFELETMDHLPTLMHIVEELGCNVILYSIYALPEDAAQRGRIFDAARRKGVHLYFVNEDLALAGDEDRARIEDFLAFAKYGRR